MFVKPPMSEEETLAFHQQEIKESFGKLVENLKQHSLENCTTIQMSRQYSLTKTNQTQWVNDVERTITGVAEGFTVKNLQDIDQLEEFGKKLSPVLSTFEIDKSLKIGNSFPVIANVNYLDKNQKTSIIHQKGEVLLLDIWATWCGPCQEPMQHNQNMLDKYQEQWEGKVRIVALSVDDEQNKAVERVQTRKWTSMEHYNIKGFDKQNDAIRLFKVRGIPKVILVDQNGIIVYIGHPFSINLDLQINELVDQSGEPSPLPTKSQEGIEDLDSVPKLVIKKEHQVSREDFKKLKKSLVKEWPQILSEKFSALNMNCSMSLRKISTFQKGKLQVLYSKLYTVQVYKQVFAPEIKNFHSETFAQSGVPAEMIIQLQETILDSQAIALECLKFIQETAKKSGIPEMEITFTKKIAIFKQIIKKDQVEFEQTYEISQAKPLQNTSDNQMVLRKFLTELKQFMQQMESQSQDINCLIPILKAPLQFEEIKSTQESKQKKDANIESFDQDYKILKKFIVTRGNDFEALAKFSEPLKGKNCLFEVGVQKVRILQTNNQLKQTFYSQPTLTLQSSEQDQSLVKHIESLAYEGLQKEQFLTDIVLAQLVDFEYGSECVLCKGQLSLQNPYFYCYFTQQYVCNTCANTVDQTQVGVEKYKYPHNLHLINTKGNHAALQNLDSTQFGKDLQPAPGTPGIEQHLFACNLCQRSSPGFRWICMNCKPGPVTDEGYFDICNVCQGIMMDENHPANHEVSAIMYQHFEHTVTHCMLRVTFYHEYFKF